MDELNKFNAQRILGESLNKSSEMFFFYITLPAPILAPYPKFPRIVSRFVKIL